MKKNKKNALILVTVLLLAASLFTGCGSKNGAAQNSDPSDDAAEAKTPIVVATGGMPRPFSYVDDKGELAGYDIELVKAIFSVLPQYDMSIEKTEFSSIFAGLDSNRYQVGANNFAMNDKRKEKYIYTDPTFRNQFVIAVAENRTDINSFADLAGKTTEVQPGVNFTTALENYNAAHPDHPAILSYSEAEMLPVLQSVEGGRYDFQLIDAAMLQMYIKEFGLKLKVVELTDEETALIASPYSYLLVSRGPEGEQLAADINGAIEKLAKDGTITKISEKYFGADFAPQY